MATFPQIAGYQGSFSGSPVMINPQVDYGWVSNQVLIIAAGSHSVYMHTPGFTLPIPGGTALSVPGPIGQFEIAGTSGDGFIVYCAARAGSFDFIIASGGGGGGGGGGAPDSATYLLNSAIVPSALTAAVPIQFLPSTLTFTKDETLSFAGNVAQPIEVKADFGSTNVIQGGGVGTIYSVGDGSGNRTFGALEFTLAPGVAHTVLSLKGLLGESIATLTPYIAGAGPTGLFLEGAGGQRRGIIAESGADLGLHSVSGNVYVSRGSNDLAVFTLNGMELFNATTAQLTASNGLLIECGLFADIEMRGSAGANGLKLAASLDGATLNDPTKVVIRPAGASDGTKDWTFKPTGELHGPGVAAGQIKNISDGTDSSSAATVGQLTVATISFGAHLTGGHTDIRYMKFGAAYADGDVALSVTGIWVAPTKYILYGGNVICDTPPTVTTQTYRIYKNSVDTGISAVLTPGDNIMAFSGTAVLLVAGDAISISAECAGAPAEDGAINVMCCLGISGY